jgi:hypothetical protein
MTKRKQTTSKSKGLMNARSVDAALTSSDTKMEAPSTIETEPSNKLNYAGILIANEVHPLEKGTLGGVLMSEKGDLYGLTCFHTVKQNKSFNTVLPNESLNVVAENGEKIGFFNADTAVFNNKLDIALVKLSGKFHNKTIGTPTKFADVKASDIGTPVYFFNDRIKKIVKGFIVKVNQNGNWELGVYENMVFVSDALDLEICVNISEEGDSGSWLLRESDNAVLGVIFSKSLEFTLVMPIMEIIETFKKKKINLSLNLLSE